MVIIAVKVNVTANTVFLMLLPDDAKYKSDLFVNLAGISVAV